MEERWTVPLTLQELKITAAALEDFRHAAANPVIDKATQRIKAAILVAENWEKPADDPLPATPSRGEFENGGGI